MDLKKMQDVTQIINMYNYIENNQQPTTGFQENGKIRLPVKGST